jgi:hypothetical protein
MKAVGIYFGPRNISLVEADGKRITAIIQFAPPVAADSSFDDKASEDLKTGQMLRDEIKKAQLESRSANVVIPGKDFIIRTFHMPVLAQNEMSTAVRFEAKKYIPFKVEELVADYRVIYDKSNRKNLVLFVGIKKQILDKYIGLLTLANIKADSVEYAGFSAIRLLQQANIREKDTVAVVYADPVEDDEVNFVVLEDGFPLFSRDIILSGYAEEGSVKVEKLALADRIEKLKVEVRVSLDYYLRKFPAKNIKKIIFVAPPEYRVELDAFVKERTLVSRFVELGSLVDKSGVFSLGFYKAYAGSLTKMVVPKIKLDLLSVTMAPKTAFRAKSSPAFSLEQFKFRFKYLVWGACICGAAYGWGFYKRMPAVRDRDMMIGMQPRVAAVKVDASLEEVIAKNTEYIEKIRNIDSHVRTRLLLTTELDVIPQVIPKGVWLKDFSFRQDKKSSDFIMTGWAYLQDRNKELEAVNSFATNLKENQKFSSVFKEINLTSVVEGQVKNTAVTSFIIICKGAR